MYKDLYKRLIDFVAAFVILLLASPFLVITAVFLYLFNEGAGAFFLQPRPGKNGKIFHIIKFKTMNDRRSEDGNLLPDLMRTTKLGRFVRNTSLDELPQLVNVLKGDMSLVGPRPLLVQYLPLYSEWQGRRHEVKPGITGWAQIHGRNNLSWNRKFEYDVWYVDHITFFLDCRILYQTVVKVFQRDSINNKCVNSTITMTNFNGTN